MQGTVIVGPMAWHNLNNLSIAKLTLVKLGDKRILPALEQYHVSVIIHRM
jgi:hypothetical protein